MKILYLNPCGQIGGAETALLGILGGLRSAAPDWDLRLLLGEAGPLEGRARALGASVIVMPFPPSVARLGDSGASALAVLSSISRTAIPAAIYARKLASTIEAIAPDLIHTNGLKMHLLGAWARPRGTPLVWHIHDYLRSRRVMRVLLRRNRRQCTAVIANSRSVASDVSAVLPDVRIAAIYNSVERAQFHPEGETLDLDSISGLPPATSPVLRVGLVGTFARWKGHKVFLEAVARAAKSVSVRGYVIGAPIYQTRASQWSMEELKQEAQQFGLERSVGFTGFVENVPAAMRALDVIVHASTEPEPFGMVIAEGMAAGKAVIVSRSGGATELFTEESTALGHTPGDAVDLAQQIVRLGQDASLRARLGHAARLAALQAFDGVRLARELMSVYTNARDASINTRSASIHSLPEPTRTSTWGNSSS
ncbi:MAG: glycosyl transferase family 1 [Terriglobia bacterium]|nr:MAG: glycosyl transferase family 1 [Terriglobia bacterium]